MTEMEDLFKKARGKRESSTLEYKLCKVKLSKDLWETIFAFSNTKGGLVLIGYEEILAKLCSSRYEKSFSSIG